jgi:hypothetical protein
VLITHFLFIQIGSRMMNPAKLDQKKAPKIRREKETRGKDQSPASKQVKRGGPQRGKGTI